ncbi:methionine adenosyltransferase [Umezawaea tangerina]|uniref:Methionine adenosyltransferase n=1 Tax=Umezawaea tangerina TaxID=84725 RepID=A0A2T0SVT6_9PSEU|nr:methionine adenosyltransferase [Umezawaea tangerina]PRY37509.1 methionine adenosyltransferase [Umezawaea tangerina]
MLSVERPLRAAGERSYEVVERKGVGHPDTMCDAMAERMSQRYSQYCLENFGGVAHHWFDKVVLYGGGADVDFGRGELTAPYRVTVYGKAASHVGDTEIPLREILFAAAGEVLTEVTTGFVPAEHLRLELGLVDHRGPSRSSARYAPRDSGDLIPLRSAGLISNDTNILHGYAPLSRLENAVLGIERLVNGPEFKLRHPETGWDVKVVGSRRAEKFRLVVNLPFLAGLIGSVEEYRHHRDLATEEIEKFLASSGIADFDVLVNANDKAYLTVFGSVADSGDVGVVGRGNRVNGLITPMRPMSIEASAGKNPLDHTGKIYNVLAMRLAERVHELGGDESQVHIITSKGAPLTDPDEVIVTTDAPDTSAIEALVGETLAGTADLTAEFIEKGVVLW